jgi:hypothetical protein
VERGTLHYSKNGYNLININKNPRRQMTHICGFFYTIYGMQQELGDISTFQSLTVDILRTPTVI